MQWKYKKEAPAPSQKPLMLQMVWLSPADLERTVDLLQEEKSDELMRKCEMRKRQPEISTVPQLIRKAERASDEKYDMAFARNSKMIYLR